MALPASGTPAEAPADPSSDGGAVRDHGFHRVRVARVVAETADAATIVLEIPPEEREAFSYDAGQFCTFRCEIGGAVHHRCYSMSSTPEVDDELQVTVKRVPGGLVSNWLLDEVSSGSEVSVSVPAGVFRLDPGETEAVAFAAGSGITPVFSMVKAALAAGDRPVRLLYANRDATSVIFDEALAALAASSGGRFEVAHHLDVDHGFVDAAAVRTFLGPEIGDGCGFYLCGPTPFMDVVEAALADAGVDRARIHVERFSPAAPEPAAAVAAVPAGPAQVTIELDRKRATADHRPGTTILQTARQLGLSPPYSCEAGSCATCMARVVEGTAAMHVNDALTPDEVADGWVLTCQAVPTSASVHVVYDS